VISGRIDSIYTIYYCFVKYDVLTYFYSLQGEQKAW